MRSCLSCNCSEKNYVPQRYLVVIMCMLGIIIACGQRECLQLAIDEMTSKNETESIECPNPNKTSQETRLNITGGVIPWSDKVQTYVKGSFYLGYFVGHIPAGILCDRHGPRYVFLTGIALTTTVTIMMPIIITSTPFVVAVVLRIVIGCAQSVIYPASSVLFGKWIPLYQRCFMISLAWGANSLGVVFGSYFTRAIILLSANWPSGFYLWAVMGGTWCIIFIFYIYSEPAAHPFITDKETVKLLEKIPKGSTMKIPWRSILTCLPVWGLIIVEVGHDFTLFTLVDSMPKYIRNVLHYEIGINAFSGSVPFTTQWVGALIAGRLTDYLCNSFSIRIALIRRIMTTVGVTLPSLFIVLAGYMGCDGMMTVIMFNIGMLFKGAIYSGFKIGHYELTVNFTGLLMAFMNGLGALSGWLSPAVVQAIAPNNTLSEWMSVFWIVFGLALAGNVFHLLLSSDQRQKWDMPEEE